jgi:hypothetical protein
MGSFVSFVKRPYTKIPINTAWLYRVEQPLPSHRPQPREITLYIFNNNQTIVHLTLDDAEMIRILSSLILYDIIGQDSTENPQLYWNYDVLFLRNVYDSTRYTVKRDKHLFNIFSSLLEASTKLIANRV